MPWLSAEKVYTEYEMTSLLLRAGQFAHLHPKKISNDLDDLYDRRYRARNKHRYWAEDAINTSVPDIVVSMHRKGDCRKLYTPETASFIADRNGIVCAVCLRITRLSGYQDYSSTVPHLERFLCPTMFGIIDYDKEKPRTALPCERIEYRFVKPICGTCRGFIFDAKSVWRKYDGEGVCRAREITEIFACDVLSHLRRNNNRFIQHVNSAHKPPLRFDPRRVKGWQYAA